jgi:3',5'-cyclic AMP phosphodiesterase CpdA
MRRILHLSDIHFGRVDKTLLTPLSEIARTLEPDLVAVSGDLTQRARTAEFQAAKAFLDTLPRPQIVVPGNHDIPLHNLLERFRNPLNKFRRYITPDLSPSYIDDEVAVVGVNTARSLVIKGGRINESQIAWVREKFCELDDRLVKVLVTHHPFDVPESIAGNNLVGRADRAMKDFADCGADLFLSGHLHITHTVNTSLRYRIKGHSALVVQAGTATSTRGRGEDNSFNLIELKAAEVRIIRFMWNRDLGQFIEGTRENFTRENGEWVRRD